MGDVLGSQEMLSASAHADFNKYKAEQRTLLETRNQTLKRIEAMRREYDFISNLDARDVNYVMEKKKEHAALIVQRNWRRLKAEREYLAAKRGMARDAHEYEKTDADKKRTQHNKETLENTTAYFKAQRVDNFYEKITEERNDLLQEQVQEKRKLKSEDEMKQLKAEQIYDEYMPRFNRFNNEFCQREQIRGEGHDQLVNTLIMSTFLEDIPFDEL